MSGVPDAALWTAGYLAVGAAGGFFAGMLGIGGGALINGDPVHGLVHTEMGHIPLRRHPNDTFVGSCSYHTDCFEGLAAGPSMQARWGVPGSELPLDHPAWELEAYYLAEVAVATICMLSPQRIILGGGVMHQPHLFPMIREEVARFLNGYLQTHELVNEIDHFIVPPGLGDNAGIKGALALGVAALDSMKKM